MSASARMADLAGTGAQVALAAVFVLAGLSKARGPGGLRSTAERLGLGRALAGPVASAIVTAELAAAAGLLVTPSSPWPRTVVALLAAAFALAGAKALLGGERIACNCLGGAGRGALGWRQVILLPLWLLLAALAQWRPPSWTAGEGMLVWSGVALGLACWQARGLLAVSRRLRGDRVAIDESLLPAISAERTGQP